MSASDTMASVFGTTSDEYCDTPVGLGNQQRESSGVSLLSTLGTST